MIINRSVYLAGSTATLAEIDRARTWRTALLAHGIVVTSTWVEKVAAAANVGNPRDKSPLQRCSIAATCLREVSSAGVFWGLVPPIDAPTRGKWIEAGYAHALGRPLVFSGDTKQSVFCALGDEDESDEDAFRRVLGLCGVR
jgi:nucleoside 2-deoxyribosyltransferase